MPIRSERPSPPAKSRARDAAQQCYWPYCPETQPVPTLVSPIATHPLTPHKLAAVLPQLNSAKRCVISHPPAPVRLPLHRIVCADPPLFPRLIRHQHRLGMLHRYPHHPFDSLTLGTEQIIEKSLLSVLYIQHSLFLSTVEPIPLTQCTTMSSSATSIF